MSTAHTLGPWSAPNLDEDSSARQGWVVGITDGALIAAVEEGDDMVANARLIAAAPLLLDALRGCLKKGSRWHPADPVVQAASAAIKAATGVDA